MSSGPQSPNSKFKKLYWAAFAVIIAIVGIGSFAGATFILSTFSTAPSQASVMQIWQMWGMSIHYPSGLSGQLSGYNGEPVTENTGLITWSWNKDLTALTVGWVSSNFSYFNYELAFNETLSNLEAKATNVSNIGQGNLTMAGSEWQYRTYKFTIQGHLEYLSFAISSYYPNSQHFYEITFEDMRSNTLSSLEYYGKTFAG